MLLAPNAIGFKPYNHIETAIVCLTAAAFSFTIAGLKYGWFI